MSVDHGRGFCQLLFFLRGFSFFLPVKVSSLLLSDWINKKCILCRLRRNKRVILGFWQRILTLLGLTKSRNCIRQLKEIGLLPSCKSWRFTVFDKHPLTALLHGERMYFPWHNWKRKMLFLPTRFPTLSIRQLLHLVSLFMSIFLLLTKAESLFFTTTAKFSLWTSKSVQYVYWASVKNCIVVGPAVPSSTRSPIKPTFITLISDRGSFTWPGHR